MIGQLLALTIMIVGWFIYAWICNLFSIPADLASYVIGCLVALGASLLWEN